MRIEDEQHVFYFLYSTELNGYLFWRNGVRRYRTSRSECVEFALLANLFYHLECSWCVVTDLKNGEMGGGGDVLEMFNRVDVYSHYKYAWVGASECARC